jgi:hypothetical protein
VRPGWDGTVEYSQYRLELSASRPGIVTVKLRTVISPTAPIETSDEQLLQFGHEFQHRSAPIGVDLFDDDAFEPIQDLATEVVEMGCRDITG